MRFKCVHESWRDLIDSRFVASHLSNSNNSRSSARIAVRHIVGGEEDDKEDVLGVISLVIQGRGRGRVRPMGRGNGRVAGKGDETQFASSSRAVANGVHSAICCIAIVFANCDKRKRSRQGQWSNGNFTRLALLTIHFGHCQARGKIQTLSHEVYNLPSELCNRKQPEEKVPCKH
ncbi:hypothetical protein ACFX1T_045765 [Malus domestica]